MKKIILSFILFSLSVQASALTCNVSGKDISVVVERDSGTLNYNGCSASFQVRSSGNDYIYSQGLVGQCDVRSLTLIVGSKLTIIHKDGLQRYDVTCP